MKKKRYFFKIIYLALMLAVTIMCCKVTCKAEDMMDVDKNGEICKKPQVNILLVGNSLTKCGIHNRGRTVQRHLENMAASSGENVYVQTIAHGGAALKGYAGMVPQKKKRAKEFQKALKSRRWDYVILQEKTKLYYSKVEEYSLPAIEILLEEIEKAAPEAKVLMYLPRGYDSYGGKQITSEEALQMEAHIGAAGLRLEEEFGMDLIPVGMQFYRCGILYPDINLLGADKKHPTRAGYFLTAGCIYQKIFGVQPVISKEMLQHAEISKEEAGQLLGLWGTGITSNQVEVLLHKGEKAVMEMNIPESVSGTKVRFSSMDENVAVVDGISGEITAVSGGMTVIMAETIEGWQTYCTVYVPYDRPTEITTSIKTAVKEDGQNITSVILRWKKQPGAKYEVYRSKSQKGPYTLLGKTRKRKFEDTTAAPGQTWYYKIVAVNGYSACKSKKSQETAVVVP
ncbi:MAG: hypothetical protein J6B19_03480 [Lachnospiraceae bacterium]|nr:hypothetical protein [Lachnospiraceae bacterium]